MQRGRRDHVPTVCADIDAWGQPDLVADESSRMREVEVAAATAGPALHRCRQAAVLALELLKGHIAAMPHINIEHDQAGDRASHDTDAGIGPCAKPVTRLRRAWTPMLKLLPSDERSLVTGLDRDDRPAPSHVVPDCLANRSHQVRRSPMSEPVLVQWP